MSAPTAGTARAAVLMTATALATFGWQPFADKPRASLAFGYLLAGVLFALQKGGAGRLFGLVCTFGIVMSAAGLACVTLYEHLVSTELSIVDEATGRPALLCFAVAALCVAAEFLRSDP